MRVFTERASKLTEAGLARFLYLSDSSLEETLTKLLSDIKTNQGNY
jgi:hypothetical protein